MIIGTFTYDSEYDTYRGSIATRDILIRPTGKSGPREPDYRVVIESVNGTVELGAAWQRRSERGQQFLSVSLDDPTFASPMSAALFPAKDGASATLIWNRPRPKPEAKAKQPSNA